jgi:DNA-binding transcriptional LysR family regulator
LTLDQLRYFSAVATYEHVGRAALAVSISPSVISATITNLEDELNCQLFRKAGRRIELTPSGKILQERCKNILTDVDTLKAEMRGEPETLKGRLRLGASHFLTSRFLLDGWNCLQKAHPNLVADLHSMNTAHAIAEVISGRIDLAVCFSPSPHSSLKFYNLLEGELVVAVRKSHPILKCSQHEQIKFLRAGHAVIHKSTQSTESCESHPIFEAMGFQPKIQLYFDSDDTAIQKVLQSDCWTFVPDVVAKSHSKQLGLIRLPRQFGKTHYTVCAVTRIERASDRALQELITELQHLTTPPKS